LNTKTPPGYRIQRATLLDIRAVHRLEQIVFPLDAYPYPDLALLFLWPTMTNLKVVSPDGLLAGFVCGMGTRLRDHGWIVTLAIDPAHQRQGLGRALLLACERRLPTRCIRLTVRASNVPAITLYRHTGYTILDRKPGYYRDGETGLVMEKCLES